MSEELSDLRIVYLGGYGSHPSYYGGSTAKIGPNLVQRAEVTEKVVRAPYQLLSLH